MVCGMGGSAIGGDLAAAALGDRLTRPLLTVRGYELPTWATPEWTVLCSSYSGETEETLACFAAAEALGARRIVASTGGALVEGAREADVPVIGLPGILPAPRTAVAYMFASAPPRSPPWLGSPRVSTPRSTPPPPSWPSAPRTCRPARPRSAARLDGTVPVIVSAPTSPRPSPAAGRPRSTRTPSCPPSSPSCPRPTTTRSAAGRGRRSRRCCSKTPTSTRASAAASS